ncbi:MAG: cell division protein FtsB [Candidatus Paceibacteria bacterium]|jgi:cell division protein FtsB
MFDFHQKRKFRTVINSHYTQGLIILLVFWVGWSAYVRYDIAMEMSDRRVKAEQQAATLEVRKEALEEQVKYLSGERGIESEMRRQFDVALEGEQVVVIVEDELNESEVMPLSSGNDKEDEKQWYQFWR